MHVRTHVLPSHTYTHVSTHKHKSVLCRKHTVLQLLSCIFNLQLMNYNQTVFSAFYLFNIWTRICTCFIQISCQTIYYYELKERRFSTFVFPLQLCDAQYPTLSGLVDIKLSRSNFGLK